MGAGTADADVVIPTMPQSNDIYRFGPSDSTPTYVETFTNTGNYATLESFAFSLQDQTTDPVNFTAQVYQLHFPGVESRRRGRFRAIPDSGEVCSDP